MGERKLFQTLEAEIIKQRLTISNTVKENSIKNTKREMINQEKTSEDFRGSMSFYPRNKRWTSYRKKENGPETENREELWFVNNHKKNFQPH